jgi:hypothetical protein
MNTELNLLFPEFHIMDYSQSNFDTIIDIVEKCKTTTKQIIYLQRNDICNQYFRIVEKVYRVKNIKIIIINGENVYYYPSINDMDQILYFKYIANDIREKISEINEFV